MKFKFPCHGGKGSKTDKGTEDSERVGNKVCSVKKLPQDEIPRGPEMARPRAEMAEELRMMQCPPSQCHGSAESRINTAPLTISRHLMSASPAHAVEGALAGTPALGFRRRGVCCPGPGG